MSESEVHVKLVFNLVDLMSHFIISSILMSEHFYLNVVQVNFALFYVFILLKSTIKSK